MLNTHSAGIVSVGCGLNVMSIDVDITRLIDYASSVMVCCSSLSPIDNTQSFTVESVAP